MNKNPDALKIFDNNYEFKGKKLFDLTKKYFDKENIPIYVYNFIDERNVLTTSEYYTLSVLKNTDDYYNKFLSFEQLMKQRDIKLEGIYKFGFLYATNEIKLLMIANSKFCKFLLNSYKNELDKIELKNTYNNVLISNIYKNLSPHINSNIIIDELIKLKSVIDKNQVSSSVINSYIDKLCEFINNIKEYLLQFDCKILFYNLPFNEKLYGVLVNTIIGESNLLYYLYENDYINFIQFKDLLTVKNLNDLREKNKIIQKNFDEKLLKEANLSIDCYKDILLNSEYSVNNISNFIKSDKLSFFNLKEIIDLIKKYGYNKKLDSYIFNLLGDDVSIKTFYNYLNSKNFTLSYEMLDFINNNSIFYNWNEDYLQQFKSNNLLEEAIRANYFKNNIIKLEANDYNKTRFKQAIINIFNKMSQQEYNQFAFNKSCQNIIIKNYDWSQLSDSNVWKFVNLINVMSSEDFEKNLNIFNKNLIDLITKKYLKGKKCKLDKLKKLYELCSGPLKASISKFIKKHK